MPCCARSAECASWTAIAQIDGRPTRNKEYGRALSDVEQVDSVRGLANARRASDNPIALDNANVESNVRTDIDTLEDVTITSRMVNDDLSVVISA